MDLVTGFGIAGLMISFIFLLELAFGWLTITGSSIQKSTPGALAASLLLALATFILVGWSEELLFRGYLLINLKEGLNWIWAVIITSVFFAVLHALNPNASWEAMIGLSISGVFFAYSALWSRGLWLPIGLHIGWNFFEGTVYGFPVSGQGIFSLLQVSQTGSTIMTGGAFGPEAGLVLIPGLALGFILVHLYSKKTRLRYPL